MDLEGHHIAELNVGRLIAPVDDPLVAEFMQALDLVNGLGKRMPGFVWMMEGAGEPGQGNTGTKLQGDPQFISNLTVWENIEALEQFVWNTVHRRFYERRAEWFQVLGQMHFVMWPVAMGYRPTIEEAMERLHYRQKHGDTDQAFGWSYVKEARLWREHSCGAVAAE